MSPSNWRPTSSMRKPEILREEETLQAELNLNFVTHLCSTQSYNKTPGCQVHFLFLVNVILMKTVRSFFITINHHWTSFAFAYSDCVQSTITRFSFCMGWRFRHSLLGESFYIALCESTHSNGHSYTTAVPNDVGKTQDDLYTTKLASWTQTRLSKQINGICWYIHPNAVVCNHNTRLYLQIKTYIYRFTNYIHRLGRFCYQISQK